MKCVYRAAAAEAYTGPRHPYQGDSHDDHPRYVPTLHTPGYTIRQPGHPVPGQVCRQAQLDRAGPDQLVLAGHDMDTARGGEP